MNQSPHRNKFYTVLIYIALLIITIGFLFPLFWMFLQSTKQPLDTIAYPPKFLFTPTLNNYIDVFSRQGIGRSFFDSFIIAIASVGFAVLIGLPAAYSFARYQYRFKDDLAFFLLSTRMMPYVIVLIPFIQIFSKINLSDTYFSMISIHILLSLALVVWMMRAFFIAIPKEIEEAALLDGCSWFSVITRVILPLVAPGLAATAVISFIFSWNDLMFGYALTSYNIRTLPVRFATEFVGYLEVNWGSVSAAGIVAVVPVLVFMLFVEKHLVKGFTLGMIEEK